MLYLRGLVGHPRRCDERMGLLESVEILVREFEQSSAELAALSGTSDDWTFRRCLSDTEALKAKITEAWGVYWRHVGRHHCRL